MPLILNNEQIQFLTGLILDLFPDAEEGYKQEWLSKIESCNGDLTAIVARLDCINQYKVLSKFVEKYEDLVFRSEPARYWDVVATNDEDETYTVLEGFHGTYNEAEKEAKSKEDETEAELGITI